jgi:polyisoprenoid-binding protein YceI
MNRYRWLLFSLVFLSACGAATPTPTPAPTLTAIPTTVNNVVFQLQNDKSIIDYVAYGALSINLPGTFALNGRSIQFVPDKDGYRIKMDVVIDGASVTAVNDLVKNALKGNLEVDKYPNGYFEADSAEIIKYDQQSYDITAAGTLTLHGQTRNVQMPIHVVLQNNSLKATGQMDLNLLDYNVNVPTAVMDSKVTFKATIVASCESGCGGVGLGGTAVATQSVTP